MLFIPFIHFIAIIFHFNSTPSLVRTFSLGKHFFLLLQSKLQYGFKKNTSHVPIPIRKRFHNFTQRPISTSRRSIIEENNVSWHKIFSFLIPFAPRQNRAWVFNQPTLPKFVCSELNQAKMLPRIKILSATKKFQIPGYSTLRTD